MRIGLFTDTYRPAVNGIVFVIESLRKNLEAEGHEVYIFCPASSVRLSEHAALFEDDDHVIRFPSIKGAFFDDYDTSFFFPPLVHQKIKGLELDVIHFFTPSQVGLMGAYTAFRTDVPLIAQHCTDLREYVEHYRSGTLLPGLLALVALVPFVFKVDAKDIREMMKIYRPRRGRVQWNIDIVKNMVSMVYSKCDGVIALSRKSKEQLESWQDENAYEYDVTLMPNGVDRITPATKTELKTFRKKWNIADDDELFGFVGRLGSEKNLDKLIEAIEIVVRERPKARLIFVGDYEYRETLEQLAADSSCADRITFTGALPRETLGAVYGSMEVFVFPSMTDTQGWVVHEAALAGLPLILLDHGLSEVMEEGKNGVYAENTAESIAEHLIDLLSDDEKRKAYGAYGQKLARTFTEKRQVGKLIELYEEVVENHE